MKKSDTKLIAEVIELTRGYSVRAAAQRVGISHGTLDRWRGMAKRSAKAWAWPAVGEATALSSACAHERSDSA